MRTPKIVEEGLSVVSDVLGLSDSQDATTFLERQHREVEALFDALQKPGTRSQKQQHLAEEIIAKLELHSHIEEKIFYPAAKETDEEPVLEALAEHDGMKHALQRLRRLTPKDEGFTAAVVVLKELVRHHVREEEDKIFPRVRNAMGQSELDALGTRLRHLAERDEERGGHHRARGQRRGEHAGHRGEHAGRRGKRATAVKRHAPKAAASRTRKTSRKPSRKAKRRG